MSACPPRLNWTRGLRRLWIVGTVVWVPLAAVLVERAAFAAREHNVTAARDMPVPGFEEFVTLALLPPLLALVGYFAVRWIIRGFAPDR